MIPPKTKQQYWFDFEEIQLAWLFLVCLREGRFTHFTFHVRNISVAFKASSFPVPPVARMAPPLRGELKEWLTRSSSMEGSLIIDIPSGFTQ